MKPTWKCYGRSEKPKKSAVRYIQAFTKEGAIRTASRVTRETFKDKTPYSWGAVMINAKEEEITPQQWHDYIFSRCKIEAENLRSLWADVGINVKAQP